MLNISQAVAMIEATFKNSKEQLAQEKKTCPITAQSCWSEYISCSFTALMLFVCAHTHKYTYTQLYAIIFIYGKWQKSRERKVLWFLWFFDESQKFSRQMFSSAMAFFCTFEFHPVEAKTANVYPILAWNPVNRKTFLSLNFCHLQ